MPTAHDSVHDLPTYDTLLRIEITPPLPCGIDGCGRLAYCGRVERDPRFGSLWSLLPICDEHQMSLAAAAAELADDSRSELPRDE